MKTTPAQRKAMDRYLAKRRAWYEAQPAEYRERFTQNGQPRKVTSPNASITRLVRETTKYRTLQQLITAVKNHEITRESLPPQLQQRIYPGTGNGRDCRHKDQYGESLEQMGKRLGISREAVRTRILRWGSPEHHARPQRVLGQKTYSSPTSFISARLLRVWGYDSLEQLAQLRDSELLALWSFGPHRLKKLRALYPPSQEPAQ